MFNNIGKKIKTVTLFFFVIGCILSIVLGAYIIAKINKWGWALLLLGPLSSWISSLLTYGFGQLVENSDRMVKIMQRHNTNREEQPNTNREEQPRNKIDIR